MNWKHMILLTFAALALAGCNPGQATEESETTPRTAEELKGMEGVEVTPMPNGSDWTWRPRMARLARLDGQDAVSFARQTAIGLSMKSGLPGSVTPLSEARSAVNDWWASPSGSEVELSYDSASGMLTAEISRSTSVLGNLDAEKYTRESGEYPVNPHDAGSRNVSSCADNPTECVRDHEQASLSRWFKPAFVRYYIYNGGTYPESLEQLAEYYWLEPNQQSEFWQTAEYSVDNDVIRVDYTLHGEAFHFELDLNEWSLEQDKTLSF